MFGVSREAAVSSRLRESNSVLSPDTRRLIVEVLRLLRYRHRLIRRRTQVKNSLRALALSAGSVKRIWLFGPRGRSELFGLPMTSAMSHQRDGWLELLADLSGRVARLDEQLKRVARGDERVLRLQTHPGIGLLTSLALVHTLEPVSRFGGGRKVAAYAGLEPMEHSSAGKQHFGGISKGGLPAGGGGAHGGQA